jgi:hypothetical protein
MGAIRGWLGESVRFDRVCARGGIYNVGRFPRDGKFDHIITIRISKRAGR